MIRFEIKKNSVVINYISLLDRQSFSTDDEYLVLYYQFINIYNTDCNIYTYVYWRLRLRIRFEINACEIYVTYCTFGIFPVNILFLCPYKVLEVWWVIIYSLWLRLHKSRTLKTIIIFVLNLKPYFHAKHLIIITHEY